MLATSTYTPLTADAAAILLVDHQIGLMTGVRDTDVAELKHNVVAMVRAARVLGFPVIVTTTDSHGMWGPAIAELTAEIAEDQGSSTALWSTPGTTTGSAQPSRRPARPA